ncbi:MAG: hypothetical protein KKF33_16660 [Alphaproteobacteria bacterium]|nr:hypothetical protein [Alphaproteobacteria bacterium]
MAVAYFVFLQGLVFIGWAFLAFRWLFAIRTDAAEQAGSPWPSMAIQLRAFRAALIDNRHRSLRRALMLMTALLFALAGFATQIIT